MKISSLKAVSPVDGLYHKANEKLRDYFAEGALIKYRVLVEVEYFIALCDLPLPQLIDFNKSLFESLRAIYKTFSFEDARRVKDIEKVTNHDLKAVEYFLKEKFNELGLDVYKEFVHFGLTSQDINNTATPLSLKDAWFDVLHPLLNEKVIRADLQNNWAVVADAIQTILRSESYPEAFEALKALTRTYANIDQKAINDFIETLSDLGGIGCLLRYRLPDEYS